MHYRNAIQITYRIVRPNSFSSSLNYLYALIPRSAQWTEPVSVCHYPSRSSIPCFLWYRRSECAWSGVREFIRVQNKNPKVCCGMGAQSERQSFLAERRCAVRCIPTKRPRNYPTNPRAATLTAECSQVLACRLAAATRN